MLHWSPLLAGFGAVKCPSRGDDLRAVLEMHGKRATVRARSRCCVALAHRCSISGVARSSAFRACMPNGALFAFVRTNPSFAASTHWVIGAKRARFVMERQVGPGHFHAKNTGDGSS